MPDQTLADLIASRKGGRSYAQLSEAADGVPSTSWWHLRATRPLDDFIELKSVLAVSKVLGVGHWAVVKAEMSSLGLDTGPAQARLYDRLGAYDVTRLTDSDIETIVGVVAALVAAKG